MYQLKVGEDKHDLMFNMGTLEHLRDITKSDPFDFKTTGSEPWQVSGMVRVLFLAGKRSFYDCYDKVYDFTADDVKKWSNRMDGKEATKLIKAYGEAYAAEPETVEEGEVKRVAHK